MFCNLLLLLLYLIIWALYFKHTSLNKALILSVAPTLIFLISGVTLKNLLLIISSVIFGISHIFITYKNSKD